MDVIRNFRNYDKNDDRLLEDKTPIEIKNYDTGETTFCLDHKAMQKYLNITKFMSANYLQRKRFFLNENGCVMAAVRGENFPVVDKEKIEEIRTLLKGGFAINTFEEIVKWGHVINQEQSIYHVLNKETGEKHFFATQERTIKFIKYPSFCFNHRNDFNETNNLDYQHFNVQYRPQNKTLEQLRRGRKPIASVWELASWV